MLSIEAAEHDKKWQKSIRTFWDGHLPLVLSVEDGYAYYAIRQDQIVYGREPEFEETEVVCSTLTELLRKLTEES